MKMLNLGCGPYVFSQFDNIDKRIEAQGVIQKDLSIIPWDWDSESIDAITSMHVLIEFEWRKLISIFREMHRILKKEGVLRIGTPYIDSGKELDYLMGWGNIIYLAKNY